jgi:magnesium-transporting ATPase (P-type)
VWILTGDKVETAVNISFSCGHLKPSAKQLYLTEYTNPESCLQRLDMHRLIILHLVHCSAIDIDIDIDIDILSSINPHIKTMSRL